MPSNHTFDLCVDTCMYVQTYEDSMQCELKRDHTTTPHRPRNTHRDDAYAEPGRVVVRVGVLVAAPVPVPLTSPAAVAVPAVVAAVAPASVEP